VSGYFATAPRPLEAEDVQGTRVLLLGALGITPYVDRILELLELAERGNNPEYRALVIARDGTVAALALFGAVAGTNGAAKLYAALLAPGVAHDVGARLMDAVAETARSVGARFLLAELPDDPVIGGELALLRASGFHEEARVPDFYRDGVGLVFWRKAL
jgi:GNAT superfamily N-acetyltransferase